MLKAAPRAPPNATENVYVSINRIRTIESVCFFTFKPK